MYARVNDHAHNIVFQWAAELGILGMATILAFLLSAICMLSGMARMSETSWPRRAGVLWAPAFLFELMIGITERLSFIRWMALVGLFSLTIRYSIPLMPKTTSPVRLAWMILSIACLWLGIHDLFARQSLWIGLAQERQGNRVEALEAYEEAHRGRTWDVQPLLSAAQLSLEMKDPERAHGFIERALKLADDPGTAMYYGAYFYSQSMNKGDPDTGFPRLDPDGGVLFQKSRFLMFALNQLQPAEIPSYLDGIRWSRTAAEEKWRYSQAIYFEPRAVRAYEFLAALEVSAGNGTRADHYRDLAGLLRNQYKPRIDRARVDYSLWNRNVWRYDIRLIDSVSPL